MKAFTYHVVLDKEDICNYKQEKKFLITEVLKGQRLVLYGRRNTGKTSLIQSVVIPEFKKNHKNSLVVYADLMGVRSLEQISDRIRVSFQDAFSQAFPKKALFDNMIKFVQDLRPQLTVDALSGDMSFSVEVADSNKGTGFEQLLKKIGKIHAKTKALIVLDEFQDIAFIEEAEAKLRNALQQLPADLPVVILGSKRHLLVKIFSKPQAPFANWGMPIELPTISVRDYHRYIEERFSTHGLSISLGDTAYLMHLVQNIPECINMVCYVIQSMYSKTQTITREKINHSVKVLLNRFRSNFIETLSKLTKAEEDFLTAIARNQPVLHPRSHDFVKHLKSSPAGSRKILIRFEDDAIIYRSDMGYVLADPLLALFIKEMI